ncbi:hypothetical protein D6D19_00983 [Aureobasidium pullulans]|uniref:SnoaL-like domain-containing protein n=1 Tax=Aureobasidium pullulans TaxID=5580 RepID=A0A4S9AJJ3_AURPU|nr:hypothetical protein D6D19_00983 [Aureobasidium pullulans]
MLILTFALSFLALASVAIASPWVTSSGPTTPFEALISAEYKTAWLIDSQNYTALGEVFADDIIYDSTDLGAYGGRAEGLDAAASALRALGNGARVSHLVTNTLVLDAITPKKWRVITWSHWVDGALDDITKTWRIFYRCDDIWVIQDGVWKLQYSKVLNMGYGAEAPYYGNKN